MRVRDIYLAAKARYSPSVLSSGRVLVLKATEGADADEPAIYQIDDRLLGWGRVAHTDIEAIDIPGGHSSMLQAPHVDVLADQIARVLLR
jgi:thioesterase domain-containing protein